MVLLSIPLLAALALQANSSPDTERGDSATVSESVEAGASITAATSGPAAKSAADQDEQPRIQRLYLHPILTLASLASGEVLFFPVTYERSLRPGRSFAIQPMLLIGGLSATDDNPPIDVFQITAMSQLRFYVNGEVPKRFYLAPALALGYANLESDGDWRFSSGYLRGLILGGAAYLGWTFDGGRIPCDLNFGMGAQTILGESKNVRGLQTVEPLVDLNLGFGFHL